jgi:hypothetical protein
MTSGQAAQRHRSIWISDVLLGTRDCKSEFLRDFLRAGDPRRVDGALMPIDGRRATSSRQSVIASRRRSNPSGRDTFG